MMIKKVLGSPVFAVAFAAALIVSSSLISTGIKIKTLPENEAVYFASHFPGSWLIP